MEWRVNELDRRENKDTQGAIGRVKAQDILRYIENNMKDKLKCCKTMAAEGE